MFAKAIYTAHPEWNPNITDVEKFNRYMEESLKDFFQTDVFMFEYVLDSTKERIHPVDIYKFFYSTRIEQMPDSYYGNTNEWHEWHTVIQYFIRKYDDRLDK